MFNLLTIYSLKLLSGNDEKRPKYVLAILDHDIKLDSRPEFQRAQVELRNHEWHALTTGIQSSSRILSLAHANAIIELPAATEDRCLLRKGSKVNVQFF